MNLLRKRMEECKLRSRSLRETARHQRDKSRQLIVACASKLQEKEAVIEQVKLLRTYDSSKTLVTFGTFSTKKICRNFTQLNLEYHSITIRHFHLQLEMS